MDLNAPLGKTPLRKPPRRFARAAWIVGGLVTAGALFAAGVVLITADPHGGDPYAVASIPPRVQKPARPATPLPTLDPAPTGSIAPSTAPSLPSVSSMSSVAGAPPVADSSQRIGPLIIDVAKVLADRRHGVVASTAAPAPLEPQPSEKAAAAVPRVAIFVGGMGLSSKATRTATELMPSAVSFAFVPYGETVASAVAAARARGHEILLQVPMQNAGGPVPGPHALRPGEPAEDVAIDAAWLMGRLDGYDGVVNLLGAPVTSDRPVMGALLKAIAARGDFYLDDGTSLHSLGKALALEQGLPTARVDIILDATADPAVVHANLEALVDVAKLKGAAIGMASGLPDHLAAIAAFAGQLRDRGVELVPVKALVSRDATVAIAR